MIIIKNRGRALAAAAAGILLLCLAICLINKYEHKDTAPVGVVKNQNILPNSSIKEVAPQSEDNFFAEYRLSRERVRSKELEMLKSIVNDPNSLQKAREAAYLKMVDLASQEEKEMQAEALIKSQGYQDCAVVMSAGTTTVMLGSNQATDNQSEIKKAVSGATGAQEKTISVVKIQNY